jgi:hypothetical protein
VVLEKEAEEEKDISYYANIAGTATIHPYSLGGEYSIYVPQCRLSTEKFSSNKKMDRRTLSLCLSELEAR